MSGHAVAKKITQLLLSLPLPTQTAVTAWSPASTSTVRCCSSKTAAAQAASIHTVPNQQHIHRHCCRLHHRRQAQYRAAAARLHLRRQRHNSPYPTSSACTGTAAGFTSTLPSLLSSQARSNAVQPSLLCRLGSAPCSTRKGRTRTAAAQGQALTSTKAYGSDSRLSHRRAALSHTTC